MFVSRLARGFRPVAVVLTGLVLAVAFAFLAGSAEAKTKAKAKPPTPIIFVHGQSGSAQQFESNAMRFTSNGFPQNRLFAYEYDTNIGDNDLAISNLDTFIANVKAKTGAAKVAVLAHSRGTSVMHSYLSDPARAATVSKYVNFDGRTSDSPPGGVPTLAVWGEFLSDGPDERVITGATNVRYPTKSHTEVATAKEPFGEVYKFLLGKKAKTLNVVPEPPAKVTIAGRALNFPANSGIDGGKFQVFQVNPKTGKRISKRPIYTKMIDTQGNWGPVKVNGRKSYEFAVSRPGSATIHNYTEPFERDDHFYRVLTAPALVPFLDAGPNHTNIAVTRMREFRGDQTGAGANDELRLNGQNVINPAIAPRNRRILAVFNLDRGSDGVSNLASPLTPFNVVAFLTGVDIFLPSSANASGKIAVTEKMRQPGGQTKTTNVPNWASETDQVSVYFKDYVAKAYPVKKRVCRKVVKIVKNKRGKKVKRVVRRCHWKLVPARKG